MRYESENRWLYNSDNESGCDEKRYKREDGVDYVMNKRTDMENS